MSSLRCPQCGSIEVVKDGWRKDTDKLQQRIDKKLIRVWRYAKFVTTVTTVTPLPLLDEFQTLNSKKRGTPVTPVTPVTKSESEQVTPSLGVKACGQCVNWHRPGCSYPGSEYTCINPLNRHADSCRDFIRREDLKP